MQNAHLYATDERLAKVREALAPHQDHEISTNGYIGSVPPLEHRTDKQLGWRFLGFSVRCLRCMTSISDAWDD